MVVGAVVAAGAKVVVVVVVGIMVVVIVAALGGNSCGRGVGKRSSCSKRRASRTKKELLRRWDPTGEYV
eukprot:8293082-Pyramimonas_sp.AAC.1